MAREDIRQRELKPLVSRSVGREALAKALQLYVGYRGAKRRFSMDQLEEGSGVKARVIECVMEEADSTEYRKIEIGDLLCLCSFLGQRFITEWLKLSGYGAFELMGGQEPLPATLDSAESPLTQDEHFEAAEHHLRMAREMAS